VAAAGVYELPMGTPLRTLLFDIAGATDVLAVYSGTSNAVLTPDLLDLPLDFDAFRDAGAGLGSGGFIVYDRRRDIVQVVAALTRFLAVESCGQCPPCKLGTTDMSERLDRLVDGSGTAEDLEEIRKRTDTVTDANRCYLPVGAALLVRSALEAFPRAFSERVGATGPPAHPVEVPKIEHLDSASGAVQLDEEYSRKRGDWTYAPG
jgi:NADH-quinone oxidoreductase subunit F